MSDIFDGLYLPDDRDRETFGADYNPPEKFEFGKWFTVACFESAEDSDGQHATVEECRMPARFFRVRALAGHNSVGDPKSPYTLSTGSGDDVGRWAKQTAKLIADGMIGLDREGTA